MSAYSRPVLLLLCGLLLLTVCIAVLNTLVPLWLSYQALPVWQVGLVGSSYFAGNLIGTLFAGKLIKLYGFNRSYYFAALLFSVAIVGLGISTDIGNWLFWRFLAGIGCALIWVVVESALLCSGTSAQRGQLLAAYMIAYYLGSVIGQLLLSVLPTSLLSVLPWMAALVILAVLPLLFTRLPAPPKQHEKPVNMWKMLSYRSARLGIHGCIISGAILGSLYGLMPLYLSHQGMNDAQVGYWMALLISSGIIGQWPVGRLADRYGRLLVLRVLVFVVIVGCIAMLSISHYAMAPSLFLLGCAGFTLYPVAMSWACEKVSPDELVAMNQALLLSYTLGSLCGPSVAAVLMQSYSDRLLFVLIAAIAMIYLMLLLRKANHHPTPLATA
ncbi:MFS transporter [Pectobacterium parmentieri]|uniref:MFS transporter n=1 Tax=Pectobacterium parmentieri TaxID=1905730 RepID=UPI000CDE2A14|nr:MFS transporter [Pectobacterium parmentieri]AYH03774.1 MFS transporter [Pectobacterium parmentieri]AYH08102.1 MFS transporter [Pectobacterium parmentieri]AYH16854.1 MFS transporter [Pectobacterium parmentieri]AYH25556.1 MFS transporter [Pectobacterium parmentieri]AYH30042.1 MFS transporter [Pectobacterium parmentieri]